MQLDAITYGILDRVIKTTEKAIADKKLSNPTSISINRELVAKIFDSQAKGIKKGFSKLEDIKIDGFGKFKIKPGRKDAMDTKFKLREEGLSEEEIKETLNKRRDSLIKKKIVKSMGLQISISLKK